MYLLIWEPVHEKVHCSRDCKAQAKFFHTPRKSIYKPSQNQRTTQVTEFLLKMWLNQVEKAVNQNRASFIYKL